jgi:hypothetical protein
MSNENINNTNNNNVNTQTIFTQQALISEVEKDTLLITSEKLERETLERAMYMFQNNGKDNFDSSYFNEGSVSVKFKIEDIDELAYQAQTDINKILKINNIIRLFINKNDILGKVHEAVETNVNPEYQLVFKNYTEDEKDIIEEVKELIEDFNEKINLEQLIVESIPMCFDEGNYIMYLRKDSKTKTYSVDNYPLGVAEVADVKRGAEHYVLINITELTNRLRKVYKKNKKGTPLFYKDMGEEIKACYPKEVYDGYINKEQYVKLNIENSGVMKINDLGRKMGLSCLFKALKPIIRLENIEVSDDKNTLARGKKLIFQKLRKELITDADKLQKVTWFDAQIRSHTDLLSALKTNPAVFTGHPWVESVEYIEPKIEQTNVQIKTQYRNEIMASVGVAFLSVEKGSVGSAQISITELMKMINKIGNKLETILYKWYQGLLIDNGIDIKYTPKIKVIDSEKLSNELKLQLLPTLFNVLNCSYESAYALVGMDAKNEFKKRKDEKELGYEDVFTARITGYTANGKNTDTTQDVGGNPRDSSDPSKESYDEEYNQNNGR